MYILNDPVTVLQKYLQIDTTNSKHDRDACQFWASIFSHYHVKNQTIQIEDYHNFETSSDQVSKEKMPNLWVSSNVSMVLLIKNELFKTVIPSKIFEAMAMKRPIILGVEG